MANASVVAVFDDLDTARKAEQELLSNGFSRQDVGVVANDDLNTKTLSAGASQTVTSHDQEGGGIGGFFHRLFGTDTVDEERGHYAEAVRRGSTVITVTADESKIDRASEILDQFNPADIDSRADYYRQQGYTGYDAAAAPYTADQIAKERADYQQASQSIPVVEETLQVGKRSVRRGGVRVYSQVIETPVSEKVTLREEHASVERHAVDRAATEADFRSSGDVIEVIETSEEAVVGKRARVVEEVVIGKQTSERTESVHDTVRHTDVRVEKIAPETEADFERDYATRYGMTDGATYSAYAPAYDYGYQMGGDSRYSDKSWDDVENDFRTDYTRSNPNSTWDKAKGAIRYGWDKVTGKH